MSYGEFQTIERFHQEIHEGEAYFLNGVSTAVATGASYAAVIKTPSDEELHMRWGGEASGEILFTSYEDITITTDAGFGTASYARNHNRRSSSTYSGSIWVAPDFDKISSFGTILQTAQAGQGRQAGGKNESGDELILKTGSYYLLCITAVGNNINISGWMNFYTVDLGR